MLDEAGPRGMSFFNLQLEQAYALDVDDYTNSIKMSGLVANTQYHHHPLSSPRVNVNVSGLPSEMKQL